MKKLILCQNAFLTVPLVHGIAKYCRETVLVRGFLKGCFADFSVIRFLVVLYRVQVF